MFAYCMDVLHLSEGEAYLRIAAARASRKHPVLLTMLADGRLHLTAIDKLAPRLTRENREQLLERATHGSKRQILELIAEIAPGPDVPAVVRKLPGRSALRTATLRVASTGDKCAMREPDPEPTIRFSPDLALELRPDGVAAPPPGLLRDDAVSRSSSRPSPIQGSSAGPRSRTAQTPDLLV